MSTPPVEPHSRPAGSVVQSRTVTYGFGASFCGAMSGWAAAGLTAPTSAPSAKDSEIGSLHARSDVVMPEP